MNLTELSAISPLDGRYRMKVEKLADYFSEFALLRLRVKLESGYLISLIRQIGQIRISKLEERELLAIGENFSLADAQWIKNKEEETRHDVKAVEYFIKYKIQDLRFKNQELANFIHFGLTSEDVNSLAYGLALKEANKDVIVPELIKLIERVRNLAKENADTAMLARTHGQVAVPTTLGKEIANFLVRIEKIQKKVQDWRFEGKLNGAVGNFNALQTAYPKINWIKFSKEFISDLGLAPNEFTTQILPYDNFLGYFSQLKLINTILIGFCQDVWRYVSDDYLIQIVREKEVGSSTMPQKVNPIDFENAEGNLGIGNALFEFYERKLPISRLQRDLSDSTVRRTFGVALGHSVLGYQSIVSGLGKIAANKGKMNEELEEHWEVVSEGVQTILRAEGVEGAYEKLKELTRGKKINQEILEKFISELQIGQQVKQKLFNLTPKSYLGLSKELTKLALKEK